MKSDDAGLQAPEPASGLEPLMTPIDVAGTTREQLDRAGPDARVVRAHVCVLPEGPQTIPCLAG